MAKYVLNLLVKRNILNHFLQENVTYKTIEN